MFEWNEEDGVTGTIWGDLKEREDHIVPYSEACGDDALFRVKSYGHVQNNEQKSTEIKPTEQNTSGGKNEAPGNNLDQDITPFHTEEFPGSGFSMDPWSNFPSVSNLLNKEGDGENDQGTTPSSMFVDFKETPKIDHSQVDTYGELNQSGDIHNDSEHGHKEDSFLDCDWASITDLDDLNGIFRNSDSVFAHDELLSPTDSINTTTETFPIPDITAMELPVESGSCYYRRDESQDKSHGKNSDNNKMADHTAAVSEQTGSLSNPGEYPTGSHGSHEVHGQKKSSKLRKISEEKSTLSKQNLASAWTQNSGQFKPFEKTASVASPFFSSSFFSQQTQMGGPGHMGYIPSNKQVFMGYGYPVPPFPILPLEPLAHGSNKHSHPAHAGYVYPTHANNLSSPRNQGGTSSKASTMTPQEKIEKLRRRQQMQAMFAIRQQEMQFGQQAPCIDVSLSHPPSQMNPLGTEECAKTVLLSEAKIPEEQNNISSSQNVLLRETIFYELQETVTKLDKNVRLCMRDSLFRLSKSAMERRIADDRSCVIKNNRDEDGILANKPIGCHNRSARLPDAETDTNPIDRAVAHLLFYRSPESLSSKLGKEVLPKSPLSASKQPNACQDELEVEGEISGA